MDPSCEISREPSVDSSRFNQMLENINEEEIKSEIGYIGTDPYTFKTTNAQEIYNHYQMFPKILVFDLRSSQRFNKCHLKGSINFPVDSFSSQDFVNWENEDVVNKYLNSEEDRIAFKGRKRSM